MLGDAPHEIEILFGSLFDTRIFTGLDGRALVFPITVLLGAASTSSKLNALICSAPMKLSWKKLTLALIRS